MYPVEFKYTRDHEWIAITDGEGRVGITDFAQKQLGDVVYVELPEVGRTFQQGEVFGTVESVKAVSELYCPMSGEVIEVNKAVTERPELINRDPHGTWMIRLRLTRPEEAAALLDSDAYRALINE